MTGTQTVPESHPRAESLLVRERLIGGFAGGLVAREGLLAHGRGEAFDYLLGERTESFARRAVRAAAAAMLLASSPVISVNGNVAALCPREIADMAAACGAAVEVNLFYADDGRGERIAQVLEGAGMRNILGTDQSSRGILPGIDSARRSVDRNGILAADLVVVPLEDGDRTDALKAAGKNVIALDLNPLSRTAQAADITIVDNVVRSAGLLAKSCRDMAGTDVHILEEIVGGYDNAATLSDAILHIEGHLRGRASRA